jgi:hypothetical protein
VLCVTVESIEDPPVATLGDLTPHVDHIALQAVSRGELDDALGSLAHSLPSGP